MTEIQNLFGIKRPTGVDMPLNKTQTQIDLFNDYSYSIEPCAKKDLLINSYIKNGNMNIQ